MGWFSRKNEYLHLESLMDFDLQLGHGRAAVRWQILSPHSTLSEDQARIALVVLQYGRTLVNHGETRVELFKRVGTAAQGLIDGAPVLPLDSWQLKVGGMSFQIWPWTMERPEELEGAKTYIATLQEARGGILGIHLKMAWGQERVLAPSSAVIPMYALSGVLDEHGRILLGRTIRAMHHYYKTPEASGQLLSEVKALEAAMPVLLGKEW